MSKRHQANRRRSYGRRQHELHERWERPVGILGWVDVTELPARIDRLDSDRIAGATVAAWPNRQALD